MGGYITCLFVKKLLVAKKINRETNDSKFIDSLTRIDTHSKSS